VVFDTATVAINWRTTYRCTEPFAGSDSRRRRLRIGYEPDAAPASPAC